MNARLWTRTPVHPEREQYTFCVCAADDPTTVCKDCVQLWSPAVEREREKLQSVSGCTGVRVSVDTGLHTRE